MERASAHKFAQQARRRNEFVGDSLEVFEEAAQAVGLAVFRHVAVHLAQYAFGLLAYHAYLEQQRRVERGVGVLLIGEYPALLAAAHAGPAAYALAGRYASVFVVAYDSAQQAVVGCGHPVVAVDGEGGERRDEHPELHFVGYLGGEFRVQSVYALDEQYASLLEAHAVAAVFAMAGLEIVGGQLHLFAGENAGKIGVELLEIQCVKRFVVVVAVLVERSGVAVHEIIVERNHLRLQQVGHQLYGQTLGGRRLA